MRLRLRTLPVLGLLVLGAFSIYLFLFAQSSFAYKAALPALFGSTEIRTYLGEAPTRSLLVGVRQRLAYRSCAELSFYVSGAEQSGFVELRLVQEFGQPWRVYEVVPGWSTGPGRSCSSVAQASK